MVVQPHHCGPVARQNFMLGSIGHSKAIRAKLSPHGFLGSREREKEREREREEEARVPISPSRPYCNDLLPSTRPCLLKLL
jgi:hypothetical protein